MLCIFFFFSSRRRHTRSTRDWSSDVCSSDLEATMGDFTAAVRVEALKLRRSRTPWITALAFSLVTLVDGLFMVILKDPAAASSWGLLGAKAQLSVDVADTPTALGFPTEATG